MVPDAPRWDNDERFSGVGDASRLLPLLAELQRLATQPDWVAEAPDSHLGPHLRLACGAAGLVWLADEIEPDGTYLVRLSATPDVSRRAIRQKVWCILGSVAEASSLVVEADRREGTCYEVVTGTPDGEFAAHGHTVRLLVTRGG